MRLFVRCAMVLGVLGALAGVGTVVSRSQRPSEQTVAAFLETVVLPEKDPAGRAKTIRRVARMLKEISSDERVDLNRTGLMEKFFRNLTSDEQNLFVEEMQSSPDKPKK